MLTGGVLDEKHSFSGLHFKNTPALGLNKNLQELADIKDAADWAKQWFKHKDRATIASLKRHELLVKWRSLVI